MEGSPEINKRLLPIKEYLFEMFLNNILKPMFRRIFPPPGFERKHGCRLKSVNLLTH